MRYTVVEATSARELARKVQDLIDQGWEPQGGVSVATYALGVWWYFQALMLRAGERSPGGQPTGDQA